MVLFGLGRAEAGMHGMAQLCGRGAALLPLLGRGDLLTCDWRVAEPISAALVGGAVACRPVQCGLVAAVESKIASSSNNSQGHDFDLVLRTSHSPQFAHIPTVGSRHWQRWPVEGPLSVAWRRNWMHDVFLWCRSYLPLAREKDRRMYTARCARLARHRSSSSLAALTGRSAVSFFSNRPDVIGPRGNVNRVVQAHSGRIFRARSKRV
mmetsp:Transcript_29218/g.88426  ORF Transcript_29218/g.88426 Transcript_29218/m.88426 type:complete len:208 (+) Transcript_29218:561-1184(+)